jgi:hypothetical protein
LVAAIVATVILAIVALDVVATVRLASSGVYTRSQKTAQMVILWAIPIAGAFFVLVVMASDKMVVGPSGNSDDPGMGPYSGAYDGSASAHHGDGNVGH